MKKEVKIYTCKQCGHRWANRKGNYPRICPSLDCHSLRWDKSKKSR